MVNFLFWNLNGKALTESIRLLCKSLNIDIVLLAECDIADTEIHAALNEGGNRFARIMPPIDLPSRRVHVWSRLPKSSWSPVYNGETSQIFSVESPGLAESFLFVPVHLRSKLYTGAEDQPLLCARLARQ